MVCTVTHIQYIIQETTSRQMLNCSKVHTSPDSRKIEHFFKAHFFYHQHISIAGLLLNLGMWAGKTGFKPVPIKLSIVIDARMLTQFQNCSIDTGCAVCMVELYQRPLYAIEQLKKLHQVLPRALVTSMLCNQSTKAKCLTQPFCWNELKYRIQILV